MIAGHVTKCDQWFLSGILQENSPNVFPLSASWNVDMMAGILVHTSEYQLTLQMKAMN